MAIHDWEREPRIFHSFYLSWIAAISGDLNQYVLPSTHYSLCEKHRDGRAPMFVDLGEETDLKLKNDNRKLRFITDSPPVTSVHDACTLPEFGETIITVRHSGCHNVDAVFRIVAPETKRSQYRMGQFLQWAIEVMRDGIHLTIVDLFPPNVWNPQGIHKLIWDEFRDNDFALTPAKPFTLVSYLADVYPQAYVETTGIGFKLVDVPLFLSSNSYVEVPLASTYQRTFDAEPKCLRERLE